MDDVGRLWAGLLSCLVIAAIMAFFCACENAAVEFSDARLKKLSAENKRAAMLLKMMSDSARFMTVNLISRSIMIIVISVLGTVCFFEPLTDYLVKRIDANAFGVGLYGICAVSLLLIICIFALVISIFSLNIPKRLCVSGKIGEGFILRFCGVYRAWLALFKPLEIVNDSLSGLVLRLFGVKGAVQSDAVTEEEILLMVDAVNETGGIGENQAEMISNVFEFDDIEISDVMTHRTEVTAIEENTPIKEAVELAIESGFSRIPVYKDSIDDIQGVLFAKDLLTLVFHESAYGRTAKDFMRDIIYVPEGQKCGELFKELTEQKTHMAVAVDEYGGTAGVVTMEDLVECIVGNIQDEYDDEEEEIVEISDGVFDIEGNADYEDAMKALGKTADENSPFETLGAMVIDLLGAIPNDGETPCVQWENIKFSVLKAEDKKLERIRAEILNGTSEKV